MVGRPDSLQTAPNLHDRMWELDGFGDYMKHSFHFQFIVLKRGITFTQMARNLEMHSFCELQKKCAHEMKKKSLQRQNLQYVSFFFFTPKENVLWQSVFSNGLQMQLVVFKPHRHSLTMCFMGGCRHTARTIRMSIMVRSLQRSVQGTYYCMADWHHPDSL